MPKHTFSIGAGADSEGVHGEGVQGTPCLTQNFIFMGNFALIWDSVFTLNIQTTLYIILTFKKSSLLLNAWQPM